jgi:hypothetical protein
VWLPSALREGTSAYQSEGERDACYFLRHCDFLSTSSAPSQFLRIRIAEPLCSKHTLPVSVLIG